MACRELSHFKKRKHGMNFLDAAEGEQTRQCQSSNFTNEHEKPVTNTTSRLTNTTYIKFSSIHKAFSTPHMQLVLKFVCLHLRSEHSHKNMDSFCTKVGLFYSKVRLGLWLSCLCMSQIFWNSQNTWGLSRMMSSRVAKQRAQFTTTMQ